MNGGVVMVVDGPLRTERVRKRTGKRTLKGNQVPLYHIQFPEGKVRTDHFVPPRNVPGTRLNGLYNYRLTNASGTLESNAIIPDSYKITKTHLDGVAYKTKAIGTAFAKKLLTSYYKAVNKKTPAKPQEDDRPNGLIEQVRRWVDTVRNAVDDREDNNAAVHIRFVEVLYKAPEQNASKRPHNTRLMVPFAKAHALLGSYYVREKGVRNRTEDSVYCRKVEPADAQHNTGFMALNVDKTGALMPGSHVSHVRKEEHDYMCRKL